MGADAKRFELLGFSRLVVAVDICRPALVLWVLLLAIVVVDRAGAVPPVGERELIEDREFQQGFVLLKVEPGKEVANGEFPGVLGEVKRA